METKDILKKIRTSQDLTQRDVAEKSGVSYSAYQKYESGEREIGASAVKKLADFYGVTTDYLLGREAAPNPYADFGVFAEEWDVLQQRIANLPEMEKAAILSVLHLLSKGNDENAEDIELKRHTHEATIGELQDAAAEETEAKKDAG